MHAPDYASLDPRLADRAVPGALMIVGTSLAIQLSAALAHGAFARLGPAGVSALRFGFAAVILMAIVRPNLRGRDSQTWCVVAAYGVSLAALNLSFFQAISLIPMGIAMTLAFSAPLVMVLVASRRRRDVAWALLAAGGVITLGGLDRPTSLAGVLYALAAGCAWVGVAYAGQRVAARTRRLDGLALALPIAALVSAPLGAGQLEAIDPNSLLIAIAIAIGGLILPFALELEGLRRLEPRTVAVIYSVDPGIAALVGFLALGEQLTAPQAVALLAVIAASVGATAAATDPQAVTDSQERG